MRTGLSRVNTAGLNVGHSQSRGAMYGSRIRIHMRTVDKVWCRAASINESSSVMTHAAVPGEPWAPFCITSVRFERKSPKAKRSDAKAHTDNVNMPKCCFLPI